VAVRRSAGRAIIVPNEIEELLHGRGFDALRGFVLTMRLRG